MNPRQQVHVGFQTSTHSLAKSVLLYISFSSFERIIKMLPSLGLILFLAASAFGSDVIELTDSDFKEKTKDEAVMLVEFFAPW